MIMRQRLTCSEKSLRPMKREGKPMMLPVVYTRRLPLSLQSAYGKAYHSLKALIVMLYFPSWRFPILRREGLSFEMGI